GGRRCVRHGQETWQCLSRPKRGVNQGCRDRACVAVLPWKRAWAESSFYGACLLRFVVASYRREDVCKLCTPEASFSTSGEIRSCRQAMASNRFLGCACCHHVATSR